MKLGYFESAKPSRLALWFKLIRNCATASAVLLAVAIMFGAGRIALTSADIRLDTGDLRWRYFGVPLWIERTPEPQRSVLLSLGANSKVITSEWQQCATFPLKSTNQPDGMLRVQYLGVAAWAAEDRQLARLMLEDLALDAAGKRSDLRSDLLFNRLFESDFDGRRRVVQNWRHDPDVIDYMARKNYTPPTTKPTATAPTGTEP